MKSADDLKARLGANMKESMGATKATPTAPVQPAAFHGETAKYQGAARVKDAFAIEVERISPDPDQPRKEFDEAGLADLASSLKARGQLQAIRVRYDSAVSRWIIISGERRYRAALLAGVTSLLCVEAKGPLSPDELLEDQLVENALREDLRPIEQATAYKALLERRGWSYRQLSDALHIAPASIARALALLELPSDLQEDVTAGRIPASTAYEVSRLEDPEAQRAVAVRAVAEGLNRSEVVEAVRIAGEVKRSASKGRGAKPKPKKTSATIRTSSGFKVTVEHRRGVEDETILVALEEAASAIRARIEGRADAA